VWLVPPTIFGINGCGVPCTPSASVGIDFGFLRVDKSRHEACRKKWYQKKAWPARLARDPKSAPRGNGGGDKMDAWTAKQDAGPGCFSKASGQVAVLI